MLAAAFRLLDLGFFRVGGESYAEDNGTYGLATMRREHVTVTGDVVIFDYIAKSGKQRVQSVVDPSVRKVVKALLDRDGGGEELLAYKDRDGWHDIRALTSTPTCARSSAPTSAPRTSAPGTRPC